MGDFQYIDHTADKGFRVRAGTREDLFATSVKGLAALLRGDLNATELDYTRTQHIKAENDDITALLVDFLSEVLTYSHIYKSVFLHTEIRKLTDTEIDVRMSGIDVDYFDEEIKAVTFHQADIRATENGGFETVVVFDI